MTDNAIINTTTALEVDTSNKEATNRLKRKITRLNALACSFGSEESFDLMEAERESTDWLKALEAKGGLQEMLAAQMLSIHQLQQISMAMANKTIQLNNRQYFSNTAIKLANTFAQQATLLAKLQGSGGQKIIVEHVEVHHGGQAIVGNINGGRPTAKEKK